MSILLQKTAEGKPRTHSAKFQLEFAQPAAEPTARHVVQAAGGESNAVNAGRTAASWATPAAGRPLPERAPRRRGGRGGAGITTVRRQGFGSLTRGWGWGPVTCAFWTCAQRSLSGQRRARKATKGGIRKMACRPHVLTQTSSKYFNLLK